MHTKDILTLDDFKQAWEIEANYFPPDMITDAEICYQWYLKNPHTIQTIFDDGTLAGFVTTLPVSDDIFDSFCADTFKDTDLHADEVLSYEVDKTYKLYFCSIAIHPNYRGVRCLKKLLNLWIADLLSLYHEKNIKIDTIFGEFATVFGKKLSQFAGFKDVPALERKLNFFIHQLNNEDYEVELKKLTQTVFRSS